MAYIPSSGSVVAFQSDPTKLQTHSSVSGTINIRPASVWTINPNQSVSGTIQADIRGSVAAVIIGGSVAASFTPPANQSVSGTVQAQLQSTDASVITVGSPVANQSVSGTVDVGNFPAIQTVKSSLAGGIFPISGSVAVGNFPAVQVVAPNNSSLYSLQPAGSILAVSATAAANQSVSGTVQAEQIGAWRVSVINSTPSSLLAGVSVIGLTPVNVTNQVTVVSSIAGGIFPISGSVAAVVTNFPTSQNVSGSVVAFQGTTPWAAVNVGSIISLNIGSIITAPIGSTIVYLQSPSIVGTYAEDSTHTTADKGLFVMGVRNDTVASFAGANLEYNPFGHDSAGRILNKPFAPEEARVEGYNSVVSTSVTTLVAAAGTGLKNYITDVVLANTGATTTLITFRSGGGTSVLGYGIAPAGGGSNMLSFAMPMRTLANETFDFQATSASSILFAKVSGFKAP